jgi:hypothetical protein
MADTTLETKRDKTKTEIGNTMLDPMEYRQLVTTGYGSGIQCFFGPWKNQKLGSDINTPDQNFESVRTIFCSVPDPSVFLAYGPGVICVTPAPYTYPSINKLKNVENL